MATQISSNDALKLFQQYETFLQQYLTDNIVTSINQNISGMMDSCKELFIFGTGMGSTKQSALEGTAEILVKYQSLNIPASTTISSMLDLYAEKSAQIDGIDTYDHLSGHYSNLIFGETLDQSIPQNKKYLTSDIIKLQFNEPVPTYSQVLKLLTENIAGFESYLKQHNSWPESTNTTVLPEWLNAKPHEQLFSQLSTHVSTSIKTHDTNMEAHKEIFKNYLLSSDLDDIKRQIQLDVTNKQEYRQTVELALSTKINDDFELLSSEIDKHRYAINEPTGATADFGTTSAHAAIFSKYYRAIEADDIHDSICGYVNDMFTYHKKEENGINHHYYFTTKNNPYAQGNIYLNTIDPNTLFKSSQFIRYSQPHALIICTAKDGNRQNTVSVGSYTNITTGLLLQTNTYIGSKQSPIKVEQRYQGNVVNSAYILDENGNTKFPNRTSTQTLQVKDSSLFTGQITAQSKINANYAHFTNNNGKNYSTINLYNLNIFDRSQKIPNTQWIHHTISALANLFAVSGRPSIQDIEFNPLIPCTGSTNLNDFFVTQQFYYVPTVKINPYYGRITANKFKGSNGQINTISSTNMYATSYVQAPRFIGTADYAVYDRDHIHINTKIQMNAVATNDINYPILFSTDSNTHGSGTKKSVYYNDMIYINPQKQMLRVPLLNGTAASAQWADLAQKYQTDMQYPIGTLVQFGGEKQITAATTKINGVISQKPAYLMNSDSVGQPMALVGRVRVRVIGPVNKFDYIGLSDIPGIGISIGKEYISDAIGIALQNSNTCDENLILCSVQMHI